VIPRSRSLTDRGLKLAASASSLFRRGLLALAAVISLATAGGLATAAAAAATTGDPGNPVTTTQNFHVVVTFPSANPCTGHPAVVTADSNVVTHETFFPATGEDHVTFTNEFSFTVVEATLTATGHFINHADLNLNQQNSNSSFTTSEHATGSDGSTVTFHEVAHVTLNADGTLTVSFDRPSLTCG
jgi:hypothetical protein